MQIDEDYYPDALLDGDYILVTVLCICIKISGGNIVAGFWQYS